MKGGRNVYIQVIDGFFSLALAKAYTSKMPVASAVLLYDRVLPLRMTLR